MIQLTMKRALLGALLLALAAAVVPARMASAQAVRTPISILTVPSGGEVYLDDQRIGVSPVTSWAVLPGHHKLSVRKIGFQRLSKTVEVRPGVGQKVTLKLTPNPNHHSMK